MAFFEVNQPFQVIVQNMIWDWDYPNVEIKYNSSLPLVYGEYLLGFELKIENGIFHDITYTDFGNLYAFIEAFNVTLNNCIFDNINIEWDSNSLSDSDAYPGFFDVRIDSVDFYTQSTPLYFNFFNCIFTNITTNAQIISIYLNL